MSMSLRDPWVRAALQAGLTYLLVGRVFALPQDHVQAWRLAAWAVSAVVYAAHIGYEHFGLHHATRTLARHVAAGVALGAFLLAVGGALHARSTPEGAGPQWLLAFVAWPLFTGVPAWLGALFAGVVLRRFGRRTAAG